VSHELSLACYRYAVERNLPHSAYGDLEVLLDRLDLRSDTPQPLGFPPRFDFTYHPPSLIVVEDDPDVVSVVLDTLIGWGYPESAIRTYHTGEQVLADLATHPISIAVVDIKLSDGEGLLASQYLSGIEVLRGIKSAAPGSRVILASAFGTSGMVNDAILEEGASYYLAKPFKVSELLIVIQGCVDLLLGHDVTTAVRNPVTRDTGPGESVNRR
jgi:CheY-like chemotaxis protein